jgi:hypothetical protein
MASYISYLRIPAMASSAMALLLSGVLYFKQKWVGDATFYVTADGEAASLYILVACLGVRGRMKVCHVQLSLDYQIGMT